MAARAYPFTPYCGTPPSLTTLWLRWNLDPVLIGALAALLLGYFLILRRTAVATPLRRRLSFCLGWALGAFLLISPVCALSVSLFSVRVAQHMLLTLIVAPLIAFGLARMRSSSTLRSMVCAAVFAVMLWVWHAPDPYTATFIGDGAYWLMHVTTFGAALLFWMTLVATPMSGLAGAVAATLATSLQMAFLGATISFAGRPLYPPHILTTYAWGLTPLQDQNLGGALMWAPAGLIFVVAIIAPLTTIMRREVPLAPNVIA